MGKPRARMAYWAVVGAVLALGLAGLLTACMGAEGPAGVARHSADAVEHGAARAPTSLIDPVWHELAHCESRGNWHINSGNGFTGGLQFVDSTWLANGGGSFAPSAYLATPAQQVIVAERVHSQVGFAAWPACAASLGLS